MSLSALRPSPGSNRKPKKIGRGNGSGHGRTSCRGSNGANSRSGSKHYARFEGGQMPLQRRLPKRGFHNHFRLTFVPVKLGDIEANLSGASVVTAEFLYKAGLISSIDTAFKVLAGGDLKSAVTFKVEHLSKAALVKIEKAGGKVDVAATSNAGK